MPIPDDDPTRELTVSGRDDPAVAHIFLAGDTYSVLVTGEQTAGRYCLIDMEIPPGGGPPPHRHDFEEMFTILSGEIAFTFRGVTTTVAAGNTVNIPANAPHNFVNRSDVSARMLCLCSPAGQEEFFDRVGDRIPTRTSPPPELTAEQIAERRTLAAELAPVYATEML